MVRKPYTNVLRALSGESTNHLRRHVFNEFHGGGKGETNFDVNVKKVLRKYELQEGMVDDEIRYLDSILWGCERIPESHIVDLNRFEQTHKSSCLWNQNYRSALNDVRGLLKPRSYLKVSETSDPELFADALPKVKAHAGYSFIETGKHYKGDYIGEATEMFSVSKASILENGTLGRPILIGHRLQQSGAYDDEGNRTPDKVKKKERTVNMVDVRVIQLELMFSRAIQLHFQSSKFYSGGKSPERLHRRVNSARLENDYWISLDYSAYDQSIPGWLIRDAFDIMWEWFLPSDRDKYQMYWDVVVNDFIEKAFVNESCSLTFSRDGVPSGSMFTQIIDTLCNLIMVQTYFNSVSRRMCRQVRYDCVICGDDNLIFTKDMIDPSDMLGYISRMFGVEGNAQKCAVGGRKDDPHFLSRVWKPNGAWRQPKQLLAKLCYPERWRDYKGNPQLSAEMIVYSYIQAYPLGMKELIDVNRFIRDNLPQIGEISESVYQYVGGVYAYEKQYA